MGLLSVQAKDNQQRAVLLRSRFPPPSPGQIALMALFSPYLGFLSCLFFFYLSLRLFPILFCTSGMVHPLHFKSWTASVLNASGWLYGGSFLHHEGQELQIDVRGVALDSCSEFSCHPHIEGKEVNSETYFWEAIYHMIQRLGE